MMCHRRLIVMNPAALEAARKMREAAEWQAHREYTHWRGRLAGLFWSLVSIVVFLLVCAWVWR